MKKRMNAHPVCALGSENLKGKTLAAFFLFIFAFFLLLLLNYKLVSMDEIWCFGYSKLFKDGNIPYKDFIMVMTPLFVWIGSLFAHSLITFRIYGAIILSAIILFTYLICKKNMCSNFITLVIVEINALFLILIPFASYNLMLLLAILVCYINAIAHYKKNDGLSAFVLGMSLSIAFLIKQNLPATLVFAFTVLFFYDLITKKTRINTFLLYALGGLLPAFVFSLIIFINGSAQQFFHYAIFGLRDFGGTTYFQSGSEFLLIISLLITVILLLRFIKNKTNKRQALITLIFSCCSYFWVFPLTDIYHSLLMLIVQITLLSSIAGENCFKLTKLYLKPITILLLVMLIISMSLARIVEDRKEAVRSSIEPYQSIYVDKALERNLVIVTDFVKSNEQQGIKVAIIDPAAYLYSLSSNDYNGLLDNPLNGNLGSITETEIISSIMMNDIILVDKNDIGLASQKGKAYILSHFKQTSVLGRFAVLKKI